MCERFALHSDMASIRTRFRVRCHSTANWAPSFNLERGDEVPIVRSGQNGRREIVFVKWGLELGHHVPGSTEAPAISLPARSLKRGATLQAMFETQRCILPMDAFYVTPSYAPEARPWAFALDEPEPMGVAALWLPDPKRPGQETYAIITTSPNESVALLSDSMPAILFPEYERVWLSTRSHPSSAYNLIKPYPADLMRAWPVARLEGDGPSLLARIA